MNIGIIVDMQEDFVNGPLSTPETKAIMPYIKRETHNESYDMLYFTQDWHNYSSEYRNLEMNRIPYHCEANTYGSCIVGGLIDDDIPPHRTLTKNRFGLLDLPQIIMEESFERGERVNEIHIMGVCTDICVISNALILRSAFPATRIYVHSNGCAGTTPENHESALKVMQSCLIDVYN